jgi:hypothetical protein
MFRLINKTSEGFVKATVHATFEDPWSQVNSNPNYYGGKDIIFTEESVRERILAEGYALCRYNQLDSPGLIEEAYWIQAYDSTKRDYPLPPLELPQIEEPVVKKTAEELRKEFINERRLRAKADAIESLRGKDASPEERTAFLYGAMADAVSDAEYGYNYRPPVYKKLETITFPMYSEEAFVNSFLAKGSSP